MTRKTRAAAACLWLALAGFCQFATAEEHQALILGAPVLPHSSSSETFDLPVPTDGALLGDVLGTIDLTEELSKYAGATTAPGMPTLDDYFLRAEVRGIALSPDGKRLAVIKRVGHAYNIYIVDLERGRKVVYAIGEPKNQYFTRVSWLTNKRIGIEVRSASFAIVSSGQDIILYTIYYDRLIAMDDNGSNPVVMFGVDEKMKNNRDLSIIVSFIEADPRHVMMIAHNEGANLYRVNIHSGAASLLVRGTDDTIGYMVDPEGNPLFRLDQSRKSKTVKIYQYNPDRSTWSLVLTMKLDDLDENFDKKLAALSGQEDLLLIERKDGDEFASLHRFNIKEDRFEETVFSADGYDLHSTVSTRTDGKVTGVTYIDDRPRTVFFEETYQRIQGHLEGAFPNGAVEIKTISKDDRRYLFFTDEPWQPGTFYVYDDLERKAWPIVDLAPQLTRVKATSVDTLSWRSKDGMKIRGYLTFPAGRRNDVLPLIVFPHGGPFARDWLTYEQITQYWATRGYAVFQPNFRGSTGYGRTFQEAGYKEYGGAMIDDIEAGVKALIQAGRVDPDRICAAGVSYGGYASLMLPIKSDLFACAVSINGVSDLILQSDIDIKNTKGRQEREEARAWAGMVIGDRMKDRKALNKQSPLLRYQEISTPLLLMVAKDDKTVDPSNSYQLHAAMKKAGMDIDFVEFEQGGHSLAWGGSRRKMLTITEAFFYQHIGKVDLN